MRSISYLIDKASANSILFFIMLVMCMISHRAWCQSDSLRPELRIENRIPKSLLHQPEVLTDIERLKSLRRNLDKYGRKHPAYASTEKQIIEVEAKLSNYIEKADPSYQANEVPFDTNRLNRSRSQIDESSFENQLLGKSSVYSDIDFGTDFQLLPVYPALDLPSLIAAGRFPAFGLMWGVEFDEVEIRSRIWQWSDSSISTQKRLYFETAGKVEFLFFSESFEDRPICFFVVSGLVEENPSHVALLAKDVEQLPPFKVIEGRRHTLVLEAATTGRSYFRIEELPELGGNLVVCGEFLSPKVDEAWDFKPTQHSSVWFLRYKQGSLKETDEIKGMIMPSAELGRNRTTHRSTVLQGGVGMKIAFDPRNGNVLSSGLSERSDGRLGAVLSKTSRGIRGCFQDSRGEPLILDDFGVLLGLERNSAKNRLMREPQGEEHAGGLPDKIRQTGWFIPSRRTELSNAFIKYLIQVPSKSCHDKIEIERYIAVPESSKIGIAPENLGFVFPAGTTLLQNFYFSDVNRDERYLLKTLGLIRTELEWIPFVYRWNYSQLDAEIEVGPVRIGDSTVSSSHSEVEFYDMQKRLVFEDCLSCHSGVKSVNGLGLNAALIQLGTDGSREVSLKDFLERSGLMKTDYIPEKSSRR